MLFISLVVKNHIHVIKKTVENFMGDHDLENIKKITERLENVLDEFEKNN